MAFLIAGNSQLRPALAKLPRLPDLLTTANLCCGVLSILLASQGQLTTACGLIFLAALFDVLDGFAARAMGGGSELGKQLDSLADMVSFGVAPGMLVYFTSTWLLAPEDNDPTWALPVTVLLIAAASAWRLAKFNIDDRQHSGFLGLPTPANALFWASLPLGIFHRLPGLLETGDEHPLRFEGPFHLPIILIAIAVLLGILMLSSLPLPSLKFKHNRWRGNEVIYSLLATGALLLLLYGVLAVPLILVIYLLSPLWGKLFPKTKNPD